MSRLPVDPVIVSRTTAPWRVASVDRVLDNRLAQTFKTFELRLYLPPVSHRTNKAYAIRPQTPKLHSSRLLRIVSMLH